MFHKAGKEVRDCYRRAKNAKCRKILPDSLPWLRVAHPEVVWTSESGERAWIVDGENQGGLVLDRPSCLSWKEGKYGLDFDGVLDGR